MKNTSLEALREIFAQDLDAYRPVPFWSWNNALEEDELVKQIEDMKEAGIGGFIMHARTGLSIEYLGEKWFSCVEACLKKAHELGMQAWVYDENGWPSGFVGGKLLQNPEYLARFLTYKVCESFDSEAFCVYQKTNSGYQRITEPTVGLSEYHCVYLGVSPANTDILNPRVVDAFLKETHEQYYRRFPESFGRELAGFFTDEPQYYRWETPYTPIAEDIYLSEYGEDIRDGLIYLFLHDENGYVFRQRYYRLLNRLYTENFYGRIYEWCEAHHCKLTGHSIEESSPVRQMWGGAGVMPSYEYEHIPAVDCLGRDCKNELLGKQVGSVASQLGIHRVMTETFACSGYDVTPGELKSIADAQYFNGVNMLCHHLFPYSLAGQGKHDHPPVFSRHSNWWEGFRTFNEYFTRLGYIVANTDDRYDVLIIHPLRDVYLEFVQSEGNNSAKDVDDSLDELLMTLRKKGVCFQLADESILERHGAVEGNELVIGNCRYNRIILPRMRTISAATKTLLEQFNGKLCIIDKPTMVDGVPAEIGLTSNITLDEIAQEARISFASLDGRCGLSARGGELGEFLFIKNYSRTESGRVQMKNVAEHYQLLDLETLTLKPISNDLTLEPCDGLILYRDRGAKAVESHTVTETLTPQFHVRDISENYLVLDRARMSLDGAPFGEELPLPRLFEDLLRADYRGSVTFNHRFRVADRMPLTLIMERDRVTSVTLNGSPLKLTESAFDICFMEADITPFLRIGENELVYTTDYYQHDGVHYALFDPMATESLRNCLYYDTNIENLYIKGDFVLDAEHMIKKRAELPPLTSQTHLHGYPFFKGEITLEGEYNYNGIGTRILSLKKGRFAMALLTVNGQRTDMTLHTEKDITAYLQKGKNDIKIVLRSGLRNLFGPHHWRSVSEPTALSPICFTMRGTWNGGISRLYTPDYQSVPFGVDEVEMISEMLQK